MNGIRTTFVAGFLLLLVHVFPVHGQPPHGASRFTIQPERIEINAFYRGTELKVEGECPHCDQVVVLLRGADEQAEFDRKGKVVILWMNVARVTVKNVPEAYIMATSGPLEMICDAGVADSLGIGYNALRNRVVIESDQLLFGNEFSDYIKLKESEGLYGIQQDGVSLRHLEGNRVEYSADLFLSSSMMPGEYIVTGYRFSGGKLVGLDSARLEIARTGMPLFITNLAYNHPALYGIVAILVAMAAGMLMGILFNRKGKGVH